MVSFLCVCITQHIYPVHCRIHICTYYIQSISCTTKYKLCLWKWESVCAVVTLFECVTLLSVVPKQREPPSYGRSSITLCCWTTIPQGKSLVWPSWLSMMQFSFLSLPSLRRKYNWEISRALYSSSKSFAYILCCHTNHQLSGLDVFVLEDCIAVAVSHLIPAVTVKESRNFCFGIRVTLIYLLNESLIQQWNSVIKTTCNREMTITTDTKTK